MIPKASRKKPAFVSRSEKLATDYVVFVEAPKRAKGLPAVVFMDGDYSFDFAAAAYRNLRKRGAVPEALIVGVGYGRSFNEPGNRRGRDYTQSHSDEEPESGGADAYLSHLTGPLWAELEDNFGPTGDLRLIAGHSLGGLVALHALFQEKPFFNGALVGAPSIWWDGRNFLKNLKALREKRAELPARLYVGIGKEDTESMMEDFSLLKRQLEERPFSGLEFRSEIIPGKDHYDAAPELFERGLKALLGNGPCPL